MLPEKENPEWSARRAAWRGDWPTVSEYVNENPIDNRILDLLRTSPEKGPYRALMALGVYTSLALEKDDLDLARIYWSQAMRIFRSDTPVHLRELRDYFNDSVAHYAADHSIEIDPTDYGFE